MSPDAASTPIWLVIVTSAGIGALISSGLNLLAQVLERRSRRRELLLSKAIDLAAARTQTVMRAAERSGATAVIQDELINAESYYQWLDHLMEHGKLPDDPRIKRL